ncbi:MAG: NAD-dependent epimerase/dehydratase family protein [Nitrososphaerota archaeon]|nr:NAD-dependent epimerase/dehydratase family protein [Nitrososphaerota archaeon]
MGQKAFFKEEDSERLVDPEGGYGWAKYIADRQLAVLPGVKVGVARIFHAYGPNIYLKEDRSQVIGSLIRKAIRYPREDFVVWGTGPRGGPSSTWTTSWTACSCWTDTSRPRGT